MEYVNIQMDNVQNSHHVKVYFTTIQVVYKHSQHALQILVRSSVNQLWVVQMLGGVVVCILVFKLMTLQLFIFVKMQMLRDNVKIGIQMLTTNRIVSWSL